MAAANEAVLEFVRKELAVDQTLTSADLRERAIAIDASVADLTGRQFHAKYALQARRSLRNERSSANERDSAEALLRAAYEAKLTELRRAMNDAFESAIRSDSLSRVNRLLDRIEEETERFRK